MARTRRRPRPQPLVQDIDQFLARRDALSALIVWFWLEVLSFLVLPQFQLMTGENKILNWVAVSFPLGLIGAGLIGLSSWAVGVVQERVPRSHPNKKLFVLLSEGIGWLGLIGIGFPIIVVGLELGLIMVTGGKP